MPDALGDDFFEIFDVFLGETFFFSFSKLITLHGPTAAKKNVAFRRKALFVEGVSEFVKVAGI